AHNRHAEVHPLRHLPAGVSGPSSICGIVPMPHITFDQRYVDMPVGSTILAAAERLGVEIPTLCFLRQCDPSQHVGIASERSLGRLCGSLLVRLPGTDEHSTDASADRGG